MSSRLLVAVAVGISVLASIAASPLAAGSRPGEPAPAAGTAPPPAPSLASRFESPPSDRRILQIIHGFPPSDEARRAVVERLARRGFGGVVTNVAFRDYLRSAEAWEQLTAGVKAARAAGMTLWLYDEDGYPSGAAGGLTLDGHPEWEALGLTCVVADSTGDGPLVVDLPGGKIIHLAAHPLDGGRSRLSAAAASPPEARGGKVRWEHAGSWRITAFVETRLREGTHATANLYRSRPYPNILSAEAVRRFLALTHDEYARRFAELSGTFDAVFTDEPSLMSVYLAERPHPALPWSADLPERFLAQHGYDLVPALPALVADFGAEGSRVRCDFWDTVGRTVASSYFGQIQDWCRAHGIASTGHLLAEEDLGSHVGFYGDFFACASRLDIPGIDCLTSDPSTVPWHIAKLLGSVACLRGSPRVMSETSDHAQNYRPAGDGRPAVPVGPTEILGTTHLLYVCGVNTTTSYYSWRGLDDDAIRRVNEHVGRLGTILDGGRHVADVAIVYPRESAWAAFVPQRLWARAPGVTRIDEVYRGALDSLFRAPRDFDIIDAAAIASADTTDGALRVGPEAFRAIILPAVDVLPAPARAKVLAFFRAGGAVVAIGDLPRNDLDAFPSAEAGAAVREIFGTEDVPARGARIHHGPSGGAGIVVAEGYGWLLPALVDRIVERDLTAPRRAPLRFTHRRKDGREFYFVVNDSPRDMAEGIGLRAEGPCVLWDPATGRQRPLEARPDGRWPIDLPPYGAAFLEMARPRAPATRAPMVDGALHPEASPVAGPGKASLTVHVAPSARREDGQPEPAGALPVRVAATVEQGGVDTWCFVELTFQPPIDISGADALEIVTSTPPGQADCGARLFLIIGEDPGPRVDYIAEVRRSLSIPGSVSRTVPLDAPQLAGWSNDPDRMLDLTRVASIRVGWGGYTGRAGERIEFTVDAVNVLRVP